MKTLVLAILFLSLNAQSMNHSQHAADVSVHGMFVFGKSPIYLNHLAMFMAPHDEQAIFEATFDERGTKAYFEAVSGLVTLVPEPMSLLELIAQPHAFFADLYDGHFERGGRVIAKHVLVTVTKTVHAHKIGTAESAPDIKFGDCQAHFITRAPDYDEISCAGVGIYREDSDLQ